MAQLFDYYYPTIFRCVYIHSSEKRGLRLMKSSSEMLQKFAIFYIYENPKLHFSILHTLFFPNECPGLCQHRPGHSLGEKNKVA